MKTLRFWKLNSAVVGAILFGALPTLPVVAQNYPSMIEALSPQDYWRFDETTPSPAINTVSNQGSTGAAGTGYVLDGGITGEPGIVGNCVLLTNDGQNVGVCYSRIDIPNLPALNPQPPFTIEFWAKPRADGTNGFYPNDNGALDTAGLCAVSSDSPFPGTDSRSGYLFYFLPHSVSFYLGGEEGYAATAAANYTIPTTSWTHVVGEFDGTTATIYINGVLAGSSPANPSDPFFPNQWVPTRIGGNALLGGEFEFTLNGLDYGYFTSGNRGWDGYLDEFAVYSTLLSSNTIASHYHTATTTPSAYDALVLASSPVGYWNFDEPAYTPPATPYTLATDLGSLGEVGTNTLGTQADQAGVPGLSAGDRSVYFNGEIGSLVLDTNVSPLDVGGLNLTLLAWIKPATLGCGYGGDILAQGFDTSADLYGQENYLRVADTYDLENNGSPDVTYYDAGTYNGGDDYFSAIYPVPPGDVGHWVFLAGTWDGSNWNLYRNGALVAQYANSAGPANLPDPWSVGSRADPNPYFGLFFAGNIEEAAVFTNALDGDEISNLYNSVALPPVITQAPQAPSPVYLGSSVTFSVWADGPGTLAYQWISNDVPLVGQTATNFSLNNLSAAADGTYTVVVTNAYGAATSSVVLFVTPTLPPVTLVPASEVRWLGSPLSFAPANLPAQQFSYQWDFDGNPLGGANNSTYSATTTPGSVGSYTLILSNSFGVSTSSVAVLTAVLTPPNTYVSTILGDQPLAYFRLDETNGTVAYDFAGGNNGTYDGNVLLGQAGYSSLIDTDTAVFFPGGTNNYVGNIGPTNINFSGTAAEFSIEAWANGAAGQISNAPVVVKGKGVNGTEFASEQFCLDVSSGNYSFFVCDKRGNQAAATATTGPDGSWHHLVGVCDERGGNLTLYIDGAVAGTGGFSGLVASGIIDSEDAVSIGAERSGIDLAYDWDYKGTIDEVAIYPSALSQAQVQAHYAAAYGSELAPFIKSQPASATNYASLPATLKVSAGGSLPLNYQWNKVGSGPITGATASTFTIPNLAYTDAGTYTVGITNTLTGGVVAGVLSAPVTITVLAPPTSPPAIAGLVMHLTFDDTLVDATGRGNNATNEASGGAPVIDNDYVTGELGDAFSYQTTVDSANTNANYASVGVRPDLQFGSGSFTVSMWVQLPENYTGNDVPFFSDAVGSTFGQGYVFAPSAGSASTVNQSGWPGAWAFSIYDNAGVGTGVYGDIGTINDGNWHNLVYVIDKSAGATVYLDGLVAHQNIQAGTSVVNAGDIDTTNSATIGQDPTGLYGNTTQGSSYIDDLGVWQRALTPLEAASIYMAAVSNQLSFVGSPTLSLTVMPGRKLELIWSAGNLQATTNLSGTWTNVVGATSPYTNSPTLTKQFFRVQE